MGNHYVGAKEGKEFGEYIFNERCISNHFIGNPSKGCNGRWNWHPWINQRVKSLRDLSLFQLHRCDFCDPCVARGKACSLDIDDYVRDLEQGVLPSFF